MTTIRETPLPPFGYFDDDGRHPGGLVPARLVEILRWWRDAELGGRIILHVDGSGSVRKIESQMVERVDDLTDRERGVLP